jgi:hypothetical protein
MNFTFQDILGAALAFCLFPLVIIIPGYVVGWWLGLFDFRQRHFVVRLGIGLILSFAISPVLLHLTSSLVSFNFSLLTLAGLGILFVLILRKERPALLSSEPSSGAHFIFWTGLAWVVFAIVSLINIQWGNRLFFSVVSFDQTTRVSIIEAMTRTGVPPINPSYYPGHPVPLTFLYYFWYILGSLIDAAAGPYVDARAALNASSAWAGLGLMSAIALYLRQRSSGLSQSVWRSAKIGIGLLAVSGLDIFPIILLMLRTGVLVGSVDVWNTWIPSWIASALWAPHHVASLIACLSAMMLAQSARTVPTSKKYMLLGVAGVAFASALGLSIYVTIVFTIFWGVWILAIFIQKTERSLILPMISSGLIALLLIAPFLMGLLSGGGNGAEGHFPIAFEIRTFLQLESFVSAWPFFARSLIMLLVLPINYLFELGFFFLAALYWFRLKEKIVFRSNPFHLAELLLFLVVLLIASCFRSTLITSNDLGWRAWLPGQFILLIWGVDVIETMVFPAAAVHSISGEAKKNRNLLLVFLVIGVMTSALDAVLLRTAWPLMTGADETRRYYSARLAYQYLRDHIPSFVVTQNNPLYYVDRPSGMYGTHQMVISDRTAYGVPADQFNKLAGDVGELFILKNSKDWQFADNICKKYSIGVLIIEDEDPIWESLPILKKQRPALYENSRYAIFACGEYADEVH